MSTMGLHFEKFQWGDPALAQIAGSDAQAYMDYPSSDVLTAMTSGPEQASPALVTALQNGLNGSGVGPQNDGSAGGSWDAPCSWSAIMKSGNPLTAFLNCIDPTNVQNWTGKSGGGTGPGNPSGSMFGLDGKLRNPSGGFDFQKIAVMLIVGALAIGIILIGVKGIAEA